MGGFFLHNATHHQIAAKYPALYRGENKKGRGDAGFETWALAVAESGIAGTLQNVDRMKLWDFLEILNFLIQSNADNSTDK